MALHHIIPKFILRNFCINPTANKNEQEIKIYDIKWKKEYAEKINTAYAINDFNDEKIETLLCKEYEDKVSKLFSRIKNVAENNAPFVIFKNDEYFLLFKFFTIMWRRNSKHIEELKKELTKFEKYLGVNLKESFFENEDSIRKLFYNYLIKATTNEDITVKKTIENYQLGIVSNNSDVNFLLHNTYGTVRHLVKENETIQYGDFPFLQIFPISKRLSFYLIFTKDQIDVHLKEYKVPIDRFYTPEEIIELFIKGYVQPYALSYVVDETNIKYVKEE